MHKQPEQAEMERLQVLGPNGNVSQATVMMMVEGSTADRPKSAEQIRRLQSEVSSTVESRSNSPETLRRASTCSSKHSLGPVEIPDSPRLEPPPMERNATRVDALESGGWVTDA